MALKNRAECLVIRRVCVAILCSFAWRIPVDLGGPHLPHAPSRGV